MHVTPLQMRVAMGGRLDLYDVTAISEEALQEVFNKYCQSMHDAKAHYAAMTTSIKQHYEYVYRQWYYEWQQRRTQGEMITLFGRGPNSFAEETPTHPHDRLLKAHMEALAPHQRVLDAVMDQAHNQLRSDIHRRS